MKNAGRAGIVPKDDFDINIKYKRLDAVMYDKSLYIAKKDVPLGTIPTDTTYWMKSICGNKEPIATTETAGIVKPDGETITIDEDGTLHGNSKVTVDSELSKESTNPLQNKTVAEELEKKLNSDGDSKDLTATFTSNDSTNVTEWTDVGVLQSGEKHSSLFQKVATMFKNIRYLYHMLGTADISTLGEGADIGTVTGALSKLNSDIINKKGVGFYDIVMEQGDKKLFNISSNTSYLVCCYVVSDGALTPALSVICGSVLPMYHTNSKVDLLTSPNCEIILENDKVYIRSIYGNSIVARAVVIG